MLRGMAAQTEADGLGTFVHVASGAEVQILAMVDHRNTEAARELHGPAHDARIHHGRPSSEMATTPASFMDPMAASSSPALSLVMAPMG